MVQPAQHESDLVLAISQRSPFAHVGPAAEVVLHVEPPGSDHPHPQDLEFYSITAEKLTFDAVEKLAEGAASQPGKGSEEEGERLLRRLQEGLTLVRQYLALHPEAGNAGPNVPPVTEIPEITGSYAAVLQQLAQQFSPLPPSNRGSVFHNLWHLATGTPF